MNPPKLINALTGQEAESKLTQIAPGKFVVDAVSPGDVPRYGICRLMRQADGSYIPILKTYPPHISFSSDLLENMGLRGVSRQTIMRLAQAGFVKWSRPSPKCLCIDVASLVDHLTATRDPEFWTPERIKRYQRANFG